MLLLPQINKLVFHFYYSVYQYNHLLEVNQNEVMNNEKLINFQQFKRQYQMGRKLGEGSYGQVFMVQNKLNHQKYALKRLYLDQYQTLELALNQIQIQDRLNNPNVIKIFEFYINNSTSEKQQVGVLMQLGNQSLRQVIKNKNRQISYNQIVKFCYDFINLFASFQQNQLVHRDIKADNFIQFLYNGNHFKLADFGQCSFVQNITKPFQGTYNYFSPLRKIITQNQSYRTKSNIYKDEVYSFGLTIYQMITRQTQQYGLYFNPTQKLKQYKNVYPQHFIALIEWMLQQAQNNRPDFFQLKKAFLAKFQNDFQQADKYYQLQNKNKQNYCQQQNQIVQYRQNTNENEQKYYNQDQYEQRQVPSQERQLKLDQSQTLTLKLDQSQRFTLKMDHPNQPYQKLQIQNSPLPLQSSKLTQHEFQLDQMNQINKIDHLRTNKYTQSLQSQQLNDINCTSKNQQPSVQLLNLEHSRIQLEGENIISVHKVKEFIIIATYDAKIKVISLGHKPNIKLYQMRHPQLKHHKYVTHIKSDLMGNLWTADANGTIIIWSKIKLISSLSNINNFKVQTKQITTIYGQKYTKSDNYFNAMPNTGKKITIPLNRSTGISQLRCRDQQNFSVGYNDGSVYVMFKGKPYHYKAHQSPVTCVRVFNDKIYSSDTDGFIKYFKMQNQTIEPNFLHCKSTVCTFKIIKKSQSLAQLYYILTNGSISRIKTDLISSKCEVYKTQTDESDILSGMIINKAFFTLNSNGNLYRNGQIFCQLQNYGWNCIEFDGNKSLILTNFQGQIFIINWE